MEQVLVVSVLMVAGTLLLYFALGRGHDVSAGAVPWSGVESPATSRLVPVVASRPITRSVRRPSDGSASLPVDALSDIAELKQRLARLQARLDSQDGNTAATSRAA